LRKIAERRAVPGSESLVVLLEKHHAVAAPAAAPSNPIAATVIVELFCPIPELDMMDLWSLKK
jgi:hypothetical protein